MRNTLKQQTGRPTVTLLLRIVPHYRVAFLERLAVRLDTAGIRLNVIHGQERPGTMPRGLLNIGASWAQNIPNVYAGIGSLELVWQTGFAKCLQSDLIVVEHANRLLVNYLLQIKHKYGQFRLAFWGHGRNMQARNPSGLGEHLKKALATRADWWFAYTELSKEYVVATGFPESRVTVVNNAIADDELLQGLRADESLTPRELAMQLGCNSEHVALFCGSLHHDKRLAFLFEAATRIRAAIPDFELIIIGDGPEAKTVREMAACYAWIRFVGPVTGAARANYFRAAKLILMPGLVGLVIVDSFATACPLFTTSFPYHSPEIAYLETGINGITTSNDIDSYVREVVEHLRDDVKLERLRAGCIRSAERYSLASMVERYAQGVEQCLAAGRLRLSKLG